MYYYGQHNLCVTEERMGFEWMEGYDGWIL